MGRQPPVGLGFLYDAPLSHSDKAKAVGLLWTIDRPVAETSVWQNTQHSQETDIHTPGGIRTRNPSKPAVVDPRLDRTATGIGMCRDVSIKSNNEDVELIKLAQDRDFMDTLRSRGFHKDDRPFA